MGGLLISLTTFKISQTCLNLFLYKKGDLPIHLSLEYEYIQRKISYQIDYIINLDLENELKRCLGNEMCWNNVYFLIYFKILIFFNLK